MPNSKLRQIHDVLNSHEWVRVAPGQRTGLHIGRRICIDMSFYIAIPTVVVRPTRITDKKTGELRQEQLIQIVHPEQFTPVQAAILLDDPSKPYPVGKYSIAADSIEAGEYGRPNFRPKVGSPIAAPKAQG